MVMNLIFLGPPGAGKGTVAQAVADKYSLVQISTGDLVREIVASTSRSDVELRENLLKVLNAGGLVSDEIIIKLLEKKLNDVTSKKDFGGIILDGFPRTIPQAEKLNEILMKIGQKLSAAILIDSSEEKIVERLSSRWICAKCTKVYNSVTNPPKEDGKCDLDGFSLMQRDDDKPEIVRKRLAVYVERTSPLIEYYKEKGSLKSYDGNVPPVESIAAAEKLIEELK